MQTDGKLEIPVHQGLLFCSSEFLTAYKYSYHSCASLMLGHRMLQPFSSPCSQASVKDKPVCFVCEWKFEKNKKWLDGESCVYYYNFWKFC